MIVKENVLLGYGGTYKVAPRNKGTALDNFNYQQITIPDTLEENQKYAFCFRFKQFNGSGDFSVMLYDKDHIKNFDSARLNVSDDRHFFDFVYRAGLTIHLLVYVDIAGETRGIGAEVKDMMIVNGHYEKTGEEIVYLPNKNNVESDNQAIFPIGGYQDIYPL